jgi:hypothetical protein
MHGRIRHILFVTAAVAGCHNGAQRASNPRAPAIVYFTNESLDQADVFAYQQSGARVRIATVQGGRTDTLRLGSNVIGASGSVTIAARLTPSSRTATTGPITLNGGDRIVIRMPIDGRSLVVLPAP